MSRQPAISVIIPAYNVGAYVKRAIESIQRQTMRDFEIVIVDDGSTDETGSVCERLSDRDMRIRVVHQTNAGAAEARNSAMVYAHGKYLYFMDGDDWAEPTMLADMLKVAEAHGLQVLVTGFYIDTYYSDSEYYRELRNAPDAIYPNAQAFREEAWKLFDAQLLYAPWNKLYLRSYLLDNNISWPNTFWDDLPFNLDVLRNVERIGCMDGHYYHFLRARQESENTKYRPNMYDKREEEHVWLTQLFADWGISTPEVREFLARRYAERLVGCIENVTNKNCTLSKSEKREEIARMIQTPQAKEALATAKPRTVMMRTLYAPMRRGNVWRTMKQSAVISWVKSHNTHLFAKLKANR